MVTGFVGALAVAFGVVFVAELGDKTQLLALGFGARHSLRLVALGLTLGYAAAGAVAAVVGGVLGAAFPDRPIEIAGGVVFLVFAVLAFRADGDDDTRMVTTGSAVASIALTIALAEMGDKTQIATATLAARANPVATWIGATAGEVCAGMLGAVTGSAIGERVSPGMLRNLSGALFAGFGLLMIAGVF